MARALVALGSNLGDRAASLRGAVDRIRGVSDIAVLATSGWHETTPVGGPKNQPPFLNGVVLLETTHDPAALLARLARIEDELGRKRGERWSPRTLDLDLLLYDQVVTRSESLEIPHPRMAVRKFVLEPAAEIAAAMIHPTTNWTIDQLLEHLRSAVPYVAITGPVGYGKSELAARTAAAVGGRLLTAELGVLPAVDPSGPNLPVELEFLRARRELLASEPWGVNQPWVVSDFWLEQSLAYAQLRLPAASQQVVEDAIHEGDEAIVPPKLTVLVETPLRPADRTSGAASNHREGSVSPDNQRLAAALAVAVQRPDLGPVLRFSNIELPAAVRELTAALEAMQ